MPTYVKKSIITLAIYFVLFAGIFMFILKPSVDNTKKNKKLIAQNQKQIEANFDEIAAMQKIEKNKAEFDQIKSTVLNYLPTTLDSSQFIVEVEGLTKSLDITMDNFSMSETASVLGGNKDNTKSGDDSNSSAKNSKKSKSGTMQNQFTMTGKTNFAKTLQLLQQMEKLSRFNSISSLDIISQDDNGVNIKVTGNIYYEQ